MYFSARQLLDLTLDDYERVLTFLNMPIDEEVLRTSLWVASLKLQSERENDRRVWS